MEVQVLSCAPMKGVRVGRHFHWEHGLEGRRRSRGGAAQIFSRKLCVTKSSPAHMSEKMSVRAFFLEGLIFFSLWRSLHGEQIMEGITMGSVLFLHFPVLLALQVSGRFKLAVYSGKEKIEVKQYISSEIAKECKILGEENGRANGLRVVGVYGEEIAQVRIILKDLARSGEMPGYYGPHSKRVQKLYREGHIVGVPHLLPIE